MENGTLKMKVLRENHLKNTLGNQGKVQSYRVRKRFYRIE